MKTKYPRTPHFPWSPGIGSDDKVRFDLSKLKGEILVVTEKMGGENTTLYPDGSIHARSLDSRSGAHQSWLRNMWGNLAPLWEAPDSVRICGENLYAKHSIYYDKLPSFFMAFSVWYGEERTDYVDFQRTCEDLGIHTVPVLAVFEATGSFEQKLQSIFNQVVASGGEGIVVTTSKGFHISEFAAKTVKAVRANHVATDKHWSKSWTPNKLKG